MEDNKDKILAVVNGEEIKQSEVDNFIQALGYRGAQFNNEEGRKRLTDELINRKLLFFDAKKSGLDKDEIYVKEVKKQSEELLKDFAMANIINSVRVSDEDLKEYYESHKDSFKVQPTFTASHILVESEDLANEIKEKIDNDGDFTELAKEYSTCPSKEQGGDLGTFQQGQMVKEFENALLENEIGDIVGPVKTQFGYHIINIKDKTEGKVKSFEEAKNEVKQTLLQLKQQQAYIDATDKLQKEYKIEKFY
ncbi:peptidylprolyl isomerase [Finegoldia magna]|uniref:peptidylprolyl isomerase n=1 Tax=Finegoldia magna TaxID=1260 RepID=UPI000B91733D|nr:peptidylprolyl isomerase [Finegoldia magna]MDU2220036.1 peptidylprolyl isomerase [Finegoldia magna]MDU4277272.1 peptidylprolyl isomerase [Finegoldia magna]OXZ34873.1 peptidylprolyl isomerase [Finegoldia magna]